MKTDPNELKTIVAWQKKNPDKVREYKRNWARSNRAYSRAYHLKSKYGITVGDFDKLLASQNGVCAVCETNDPGTKGWAVDHDHVTGKNRGILCQRCNIGLGYFRDRPELLLAAVKYLKLHGESNLG